MLGWVRSILGGGRSGRPALSGFAVLLRAKPGCRSSVEGRFDAAQTTPDNRKHWANADHLSADAAANRTIEGDFARWPGRWTGRAQVVSVG